MRVVKLLTVGGIALILTLGACSSDSGPSAQSGGPTTTEPGGTTTRPDGATTIPPEGPTTSAGRGSSADLCATVGKLGKSIAAVRGDSPKEAQAKLDAIQQDYEAVKRAAGGELSIQAGDVGQALADLENEASTGGSQVSDKLAKAQDRLDAAAGCP